MLRDWLKRVSGGSGDTLEQARQLIAAGNRSEDAGHLPQACGLYRQAVQLAPRLPAAHLNLGIALAAAGDPKAAAQAFEAVLAIDPDHAFGNYNFANLAYAQGDADTAQALVRRALRAKPNFVEAHVLLSNLLDEAGQADGAAAALEEAIRLRPDYAGAHFNHALLLQKLGRLEQARAAADRALRLDPEYPEAATLMASILSGEGFMLDSLQWTRRAIEHAPQRFDLRSRELFALNMDERIEPGELFRKHAEFGALLEQAVPERFAAAHPRGEDPQRRLRVGFVSGDFRVHPVTLFLLPVLELLDRAAFEVFCYDCGARADHVTGRVRSLSDKWIEAAALSDAQLAQSIHEDGIEILVDLSGHSGALRLAVFCEKPAPVQVTWLGYLNTTGLTRMDYRLCDARTDPPDTTSYHSETLIALPDSQWCYRPFLEVDCASAAPFERAGCITFGAFNAPAKISPVMCQRWAEILGRVPQSRLLIAGVSSQAKKDSILAVMEQAGIAADRLRVEPRVELGDYYAFYNDVDIALDSYPYGGGTTTLDSLWMGVPVLTAIGGLPGSRSAGSILSVLGLSEWIAPAIDYYVRLAVERASDREAIARLRRSLRVQLAASPLMDEQRYVRNFEAALRRMWVDHCARTDTLAGER